MKEFIEKLIGRLEEESYEIQLDGAVVASTKNVIELSEVKEISKELAEEYNLSMTNGGCVDCDECEHRSEDCLCDISENEEVCPLVSNNGWIPCENELPDTSEWHPSVVAKEFLVTYYPDEVTKPWVGIRYFRKDTNDFLTKKEEKVIAWKPLPASYKPKGE